MKQALKINRQLLRQLIVFVALLPALMIPGMLFAQTDSTVKAETEVAEESSLIAPSLTCISVQKADSSIDLNVAMKAKVKGSFINLPLLKVKLLLVSDTAEKEIGFVITNEQGKAVLNCKPGTLMVNKEGKLHFKAVFAGNKMMDAADAEVTIKRAHLGIIVEKGDSLVNVKIKLTDVGTGTEMPVPEIAVGIFVKRLFFPLKVAEGTTDANGEATIEIPDNLPGDAKGNITLLAKLDESELYGNLEASVVSMSGKPVSDADQVAPRALWSAHPPLWMMVTFIILMVTVWGHYVVIVYELFRLRKEEPHPPVNANIL